MVPMPSSAGDPPGTIPEAPSPAQPLPEDRKGPFQTQLRTPAGHLQSPAPAARFGSGLPLSGRGKRKSTHGRKRAKGEGRRDRLRRSWAPGCARHKDPKQHGLLDRGAETPTRGLDRETVGPAVGVFSLRDCEAEPPDARREL